MTKIVTASIQREVSRTIAYADGTVEQDIYAVHIPEQVDVRAIRVRLNMTQQQFAIQFGFSINTLRHWEQGRRIPEGPTRAYLLVIDREPEAVQKALRIA
jgi:putative transcriptional regulator